MGGTILLGGQTLFANTTTTFNLQTIAGCDSIVIVNVTEILVSVFEGIPDIFSPNGDGVNDLFFSIGLNQNKKLKPDLLLKFCRFVPLINYKD